MGGFVGNRAWIWIDLNYCRNWKQSDFRDRWLLFKRDLQGDLTYIMRIPADIHEMYMGKQRKNLEWPRVLLSVVPCLPDSTVYWRCWRQLLASWWRSVSSLTLNFEKSPKTDFKTKAFTSKILLENDIQRFREIPCLCSAIMNFGTPRVIRQISHLARH